MDPAAKRAAKIERFKADKRLKAQLSLLEEQRRKALATHSLSRVRLASDAPWLCQGGAKLHPT